MTHTVTVPELVITRTRTFVDVGGKLGRVPLSTMVLWHGVVHQDLYKPGMHNIGFFADI